MSELFVELCGFDGDISGWDVSNMNTNQNLNKNIYSIILIGAYKCSDLFFIFYI